MNNRSGLFLAIVVLLIGSCFNPHTPSGTDSITSPDTSLFVHPISVDRKISMNKIRRRVDKADGKTQEIYYFNKDGTLSKRSDQYGNVDLICTYENHHLTKEFCPGYSQSFYEYDSLNRLSRSFVQLLEERKWQPASETLYYYNKSNKLDSTYLLSYSSGFRDRTYFSYSNAGLLEEKVTYHSDSTTAWYKSEREYYNNDRYRGRVYIMYSTLYNPDGSLYFDEIESVFEYNENGDIISKTNRWGPIGLTTSQVFLYEYDNRGLCVKARTIFRGDTLVGEKEYYTK